MFNKEETEILNQNKKLRKIVARGDSIESNSINLENIAYFFFYRH